MIEDVELLRRYAKDGCAKSFELIVRRHIGWVYSASLRMVRDAALAEDLTQSVFVLLENRAGSLKEGVALSGWLFNTLRFVARESRRKDQRRRRHEARAALPESAKAPNGVDDAVWEQMSPMLEEAVATLVETDRRAVLLRFYEGADFAQIGKTLGISEVTARKRVSRAVKRLGAFFKQKGVIVPAVLLASALFARAAQAAPGGLVESIVSAAGGHAGAALAGSLVRQTTMRFMVARRRLAAAIVACMGLLGVGLWAVLAAWVVRAPEEGEGARTPLSGHTSSEWHTPVGQFLPDEIELPGRTKQGYARYDFNLATTRPRAQTPMAGLDALWWFRELYDLRNSPRATQAQARSDEPNEEEMFKDPRTGEMHPRSWFEEHGYPSFDEHDGGGGGGGRAGDARLAGTSDAGPGKSASGAGVVGLGGDLLFASSSSAGNSTNDMMQVALSKTDPAAGPGTNLLPKGTGYSRNQGSSNIIWTASDVEGESGGYYILTKGHDKSLRIMILHHEAGQPIGLWQNGSDASPLTSDSHGSNLLINQIGMGADGQLELPASDVPAGFDPNNPTVLAELNALRAQYGDISPGQISYGYFGGDGRIVWAAVPEPGMGLVEGGIVLLLSMRRRVRAVVTRASCQC